MDKAPIITDEVRAYMLLPDFFFVRSFAPIKYFRISDLFLQLKLKLVSRIRETRSEEEDPPLDSGR